MNERIARLSTGSALGRLRRLPQWLTALACATAAVGLIVLGTLLVRADIREREAVLDGQLRRVTSSVVRLVHYDGTMSTVDVGEDELNNGCPEFAILPGPPPQQFPGYFSEGECVSVDPAVLADLAEDAVQTGYLLTGYVRDTDGRRARVGVEPFRHVGLPSQRGA